MAELTPSSEDNRIYEVAVLYPYPINQKEESDLQKSIEAVFADAGAKQVMKDVWGRRGLAYKIGGFTEGTFVIYYYDMDPAALKDVDQQLRILKGLLRHMIVKPPKKYQITPYADRFAQWKEQEKAAGEKAAADREEKLKKQVVEKAKRQTKKEEKKEAPAKPMSTETIAEGLDKLISDQDIEL
ncbi:MAG TPA: 30S ribosomal protein S6 [Candidatus Peribacteraceae bacterium]|nr:30S ribosomal protein S6 [Candidatus Peribacteraceae bacterium]